MGSVSCKGRKLLNTPQRLSNVAYPQARVASEKRGSQATRLTGTYSRIVVLNCRMLMMTQFSDPLEYVTPETGREGRRLKRRRIFTWLGIIAGFALALLIGAVVLLRLFLVHVGLVEHSFDQKLADQVVTQVANGTLKAAPGGVITLPPALAPASLYGQAYVTIDPAGQTWILFRTWQGKGSNLYGYLYHSTPATGLVPANVSVIGPSVTTTGMIQYDVVEQDGPNWYRVKWDLD